jgi:hypothetical protein
LCLFALMMGCRSADEEHVYPVTGQVLLDGKPLAEAVVILHRLDHKGRNLTAHTDTAGRFVVTTNQPGDGAAAGSYEVTVEYRQLVQEGDEKMRTGPNLLPPRYAKPGTSLLRCEVKEGPNEFPPWDLSSR